MIDEKWKNLLDALATMENYEDDSDPILLNALQWWNKLPYEDRMKAFMAVCKLIHRGEVEENGSYRYVLYEVFNFNADAYENGMICGFMTLHNLLKEGKAKNESES